jgi:endoglucanase
VNARLSPGARAAAAAAALAILAGLGGCGSARATDSSNAQSLATADARSFLRTYVAPDGRVVRRDQGGDTVSEGQGYAMLMAFATDARSTFARVWSWTRANLQLPNHLFAFRWANGAVVSAAPAADADVQIAWALQLAGAAWHNTGFTTAARQVAAAVAAAEIGYDDQGQPTLAAGPWAAGARQPVTVEPGYWTFPADRALARLTNDHRWQALAGAELAHLEQLTSSGHQLPPDWAQLGNGSPPHPIGSPASPSQRAQSGQNGLRALVWAHCTAAVDIESGWWRLLSSTAAAAPLTRGLNGQPADADKAPLSDVAAASAAEAAGETSRSESLLASADTLAKRYPTYYGSAWAALGRIILTTNLLPGCEAR